ncbi:hypothetical protein PsalN5692_00591 [Piscirickettsia salmonis]|uniref:hypothetical protein n=1 Tax=Piscirickettsia salmonis TaxID=1238 RepID=UPI0012B7F3D0|nr:hypothetical protein [Piscirickettsia salmonis]QGP49169.1 hypothetical protein PsalN5692_00591 [Piscirickettsia salmonis]
MKIKALLATALTSSLIATAAIASSTASNPPPLQGTQCNVGQQCSLSNGMAYFELNQSQYGLYTCKLISGDQTNTHIVTLSTGKDAQNVYLARVGTEEFKVYIQEQAKIFRKYNGVGEIKFVGTSGDAISCTQDQTSA